MDRHLLEGFPHIYCFSFAEVNFFLVLANLIAIGIVALEDSPFELTPIVLKRVIFNLLGADLTLS